MGDHRSIPFNNYPNDIDYSSYFGQEPDPQLQPVGLLFSDLATGSAIVARNLLYPMYSTSSAAFVATLGEYYAGTMEDGVQYFAMNDLQNVGFNVTYGKALQNLSETNLEAMRSSSIIILGGHANPYRLGYQPVLTKENMPKFTGFPFVSIHGCSVGRIDDSDTIIEDTMTFNLLKNGAVGVLAPTRESVSLADEFINSFWAFALYSDNQIGVAYKEALRVAKLKSLSDQGYSVEEDLVSFELYGDPSLKLNVGQPSLAPPTIEVALNSHMDKGSVNILPPFNFFEFQDPLENEYAQRFSCPGGLFFGLQVSLFISVATKSTVSITPKPNTLFVKYTS